MMPSNYLGVAASPTPAFYTDAFLNDLSQQMALSQASRRLSRGSNGQQRAAGAMSNAMRVAKPTSANNSPRSSTMARRRTLMNDASLAARRRQYAMDQAVLPMYAPEMPNSQPRTNRPLSWHPSTYPQYHHVQAPSSQQQQQLNLNQYPFPVTMLQDEHDASMAYQSHYSPIPAAYSCSTSPSLAFSPLPLPFNTHETTPGVPVEGWSLPPQSVPTYVSAQSAVNYAEPFPALPAAEFATSALQAQWGDYAQGLHSTSPPTPENLPASQQPQPVVSTEESIPYQPLDESEEEGEILVGMGLYDAPDKYDDDPQLNNSRSAMSSLFGASYRAQEGTGKGLKLEEAWQPPESDDEDEDEDADGEDQDEDEEEPAQAARKPQAV